MKQSNIRFIPFTFLCIAFIGNAVHAQTKDPLQILATSTAALKNYKTISFDGNGTGLGALESKRIRTNVHVIMKRVDDITIPYFTEEGQVQKPGFDKPEEEKIIHNGTVYQQEESNGTIAYQAHGTIAENGTRYIGFGSLVWYRVFTGNDPFALARKTGDLSMEETETDGTRCYCITVPLGSLHNKYYISKENNLPVRIETIDDQGTYLVTFKNVIVNSPVDDNAFVPGKVSATTVASAIPVNFSLAKSGDKAPDWELQTLNGATQKLSDLKGKVVVLDFFASWCAPCRLLEPSVKKISDTYTNKAVVVIGMDYHETSIQKITDFCKTEKIQFPVALNAEKIAAAYGVSSIPVVFIIGKDGKIAYSKEGYTDGDEKKLVEQVQKVLSSN